MGAVFIDQGNERPITSAAGPSQPGCEFQTASAATHDDDFVLCAHWYARNLYGQFSAGDQATCNAAFQGHPEFCSLYEMTGMCNPNDLG